MVLRTIPRILFSTLVLGLLSFSAFAQSAETRPRVLAQNADPNEISCAPDDAIFAAPETATATTNKPEPKGLINLNSSIRTPEAGFIKFQPLLLAAIDERLGSPYSWGATGPRAFDCSGFVWSIFQSAGISFERGSARTLFARFTPATPEEQYKFGTLVFFSGLAHVGVVADEHGFYHASRHHGVVYSPFNDYWLSRIDGFRRVPLPATQITD